MKHEYDLFEALEFPMNVALVIAIGCIVVELVRAAWSR